MSDDEEKKGKRPGEDESVPTASFVDGARVPGGQIGPYKLLSILGEGGHGVVYLAEQQKPIRRQVALKIIKPGMDTKQVVARFEAERQALALLNHPNIASVHDAGTTKSGLPYFVMEFVKGVPITEHCDRQKSSIEERLRLFSDVCDAIQYAHQKGIIHRDIKPSNILVSFDRESAIPKVIDFGIAKAISQPLTERTLYTEQGQFIGTPEYMSPEQAEMTTQDIDTRSDIYSLGVVMYELLIGVLPFDPKTLREAGIDRLRQIIREQEPKTPSTRLSHLGEKAEQIATKRHTEVGTLTKRLHKELEWIPMKAMRKERIRRYRSVSELADDIQNYLNGAPLIAGPESVVYKARKFVWRHAGTVAAATAIVVLLVVGLAVSTTLYVKAEQAARIAEERAESLRRSNYGNHIALAESAYRDGHAERVSDLLTLCPVDLRGWEWDWLSYISDEADLTLLGYPEYKHVKEITSVVLSPDGKRVYVAGVKGGIQVWDLDSGSEVMTLFVGDWIWSIAIDPAGKRLVTGTMGGTIQLWDTLTGDELMTLQKGYYEPYPKGKSDAFSVAFSPDGKRIVSGGKTIQVWDASTGERLMILKGHTDSVKDVAFSPDGRRIASGSFDETVKVWDADTGNELMTLAGHKDKVICVAFSPDGKMIASGSNDRTIGLWDAETGENIRTIYGHTGAWIFSVSFSPDGKRIVSGSSDCTVKVWDVESGAEMSTLRGHGMDVTSVVFSLDGKRVISGSYDKSVKVWNPAINREHAVLHGHNGWVLSVSFSPDGKKLISGGNDGMIKMWDVASACEVTTLHGHKDKVHCVSFSQDGKTIVSASADTRLKLWDAVTGREVMALSGHLGSVNCAAFSPDGKRIVSGSDDKTIKFWDVATGNELMTLTGHEGCVSSVGFSPHGDRIVSGGEDGLAKIWDSFSGKELASIRVNERKRIQTFAIFTPDSKHIVAGSKWIKEEGVRIWDVYKHRETMALRGINALDSIAFTPDAKRIITAGGAKVTLWDMVSGAEVFSLRALGRAAFSVDASPNGNAIAYGNENGTVVLLESTVPTGGYEPRINAESARKLVDWMHTECGSYKEVLQKLETDTSLDESVRKFGLQIARSRLGEDSRKLVE